MRRGGAPAGDLEGEVRLRRVGDGIVVVGLCCRLIGAAAFRWWVPAPDFAIHCLLSCLLYALAGRLVRAGKVDAVIVLGALEWTLAMLHGSAAFGVHAGFESMVPVLSIGVLMYGHLPFNTRVAMAVAPVAIFLPVYQLSGGLEPMVRLDTTQLAIVSSANFVFFSAVTILITASMVRMVEQARNRAVEIGEARAQLIADMSHELRTPAATNLAAAQAALRHAEGIEEYRETLELIERGSRGMGQIVERMLELASLDRGEREAKALDDLEESARAIADEFLPLAAEREIRIEFRAEPVLAKTDETILRIVLGNILANAIRYSPPGGVVDVRLLAGPAITIRDQGPGIAAADLPSVFERFWRADRSRSRKGGNFGLGLAIAREYAAVLGARIDVTSEPGKGSTFGIRW